MRGLALIVILMAAGCAGQTSTGRATTLAPGRAQVSGGAELSVVSVQATREGAVPLPWLELAAGYRRGITERVELGARVHGLSLRNLFATGGVDASAKVQLRRAPQGPGGAGLDVALVPTIAYHQANLGGALWHVGGISVPVLLGWNLGAHQLIVGPRLAYYVLGSYGQEPVSSWWIGTSVGVAIRLGRRFELVPELLLAGSNIGFGSEDASEPLRGAGTLQLGVSGHFEL